MKDSPPSSREPTPFEKFRELTKKVIAVPKSEVDKREAEWQRERAKKKRGAKTR